MGLYPVHGFVSLPLLPLGLGRMGLSWRDEALSCRIRILPGTNHGAGQAASFDLRKELLCASGEMGVGKTLFRILAHNPRVRAESAGHSLEREPSMQGEEGLC